MVMPWVLFLDYWQTQGPIMWALHLVAILTLAVVLDRSLFWVFARARSRSITCLREARAGQAAECLAGLSACRGRPDYLAAIARVALRGDGGSARAISTAQSQLDRMDRRLGMLDWSVATAPLLGILGTAIGMAIAFRQNASGLPDPGALGQGISLALRTTIWGLSISILAATARAVLRGIRQRAFRRMEMVMELVNHVQRSQRAA
jgi:biopolymer transport protein ExbB